MWRGQKMFDKSTQYYGSLKNEERWLNHAEAADYLRLSSKSLYNLCSNGKIRFYKIGRRNRYLLDDLRNLSLANPKGGF